MRNLVKKVLMFNLIPAISDDDFSLVRKAVLGKDKPHPHLRTVNGNSFKLMKNSREMITEIHSLEELSRVLEITPAEAIRFHTRNRNDFAIWIREVVGNNELSKKIETLRFDSSEEMRWKLVSMIYNEVLSLKLSQLYANNL